MTTRGVTQLAPVLSIIGMSEDIHVARQVHQQIVSCFATHEAMRLLLARHLAAEVEYLESGNVEKTLEELASIKYEFDLLTMPHASTDGEKLPSDFER